MFIQKQKILLLQSNLSICVSTISEGRLLFSLHQICNFSKTPSGIYKENKMQAEVKMSIFKISCILETLGLCRQMHNCLPAVVFARVLFHGEHVLQINPLYVHVLGRKLILTVNFLADRQITARSFLTLYYQSDY